MEAVTHRQPIAVPCPHCGSKSYTIHILESSVILFFYMVNVAAMGCEDCGYVVVETAHRWESPQYCRLIKTWNRTAREIWCRRAIGKLSAWWGKVIDDLFSNSTRKP